MIAERNFDRKDVPILVEGIAITPERASSLPLKNLKIKAAFTGFADASSLDHILAYAHKHKDWIYKVLQENDNKDDSIRSWFNEELAKNQQLAAKVKKFGYAFFPVDSANFEKYCDTVAKYFLN